MSTVLRPIYVVSKKEFRTNLLSVRMAILVAILGLVVVGGSYGFAGLVSTPQSREQVVLWAHPVVQGTNLGVVAFVSDAWGVPHEGATIELYREAEGPGPQVPVDSGETDADGFVRFSQLEEGFYGVAVDLGGISWQKEVFLKSDLPYEKLSLDLEQFDLDSSGFMDDLALHLMDIDGGVATAATVVLEGEEVGSPDARGFFSLKLAEGQNNVTILYEDEVAELFIQAFPSGGIGNLFAAGPDFVLFFIAISFGALLLPIAAIALSYDSISKERIQGSADLLLYRPASWRAVALGKFLGIFTSMAVPLAAVILTGVLLIALVTGTWPSAPVIGGFLAFSLFLVAAYILLMQSLSTVAKSAGTAILFGVVLWFVYSLLWSVVVFLVTLAIGHPVGSREYFVVASYMGIGNPNDIYTNLFVLVAPESIRALGLLAGTSGGLFALPNWVPVAAAAAWIAAPLLLFLELYRRKAAG